MPRYLPAVLAVLTGLLLSGSIARKQAPNSVAHTQKARTVCQSTPGLSRPQIELCWRRPDVVMAAIEGLEAAVTECRHQFRFNRWNCSSTSAKTRNLSGSPILKRGLRESAFVSAVSSASVVIAIARACSKGLLKSCDCDNRYYNVGEQEKNSIMKMYGCSDNVRFAIRFSRKFLEETGRASDMHSQVVRHNGNVGRMTVKENMELRQRCHGISGSCQMKTFWRSVPDLRVVGTALKAKFKTAIRVSQTNSANRRLIKNQVPGRSFRTLHRPPKTWPLNRKRRRGSKSELFFYEDSPDFCERNEPLQAWGTSGRPCNYTHKAEGSCDALCCGRGHHIISRTSTQSCNCRFRWCCNVDCQSCNVTDAVGVCN